VRFTARDEGISVEFWECRDERWQLRRRCGRHRRQRRGWIVVRRIDYWVQTVWSGGPTS
jgi:hypothetical protein